MAGRYKQFSADVVTDASGNATVFLPGTSEQDRSSANGDVIAIVYTKDDYDAGVDFTITTSAAGLTIWTEADVNASKTVFPQTAATGTDGVAMLYAAAGLAVPAGPVPLANERVKIVIASGGNAKTGNFRVILG